MSKLGAQLLEETSSVSSETSVALTRPIGIKVNNCNLHGGCVDWAVVYTMFYGAGVYKLRFMLSTGNTGYNGSIRICFLVKMNVAFNP